MGGIGKVLITLGLLLFAFVGYQLWGTGIETARAQSNLKNEFQRILDATTTTASTAPSTTDPTVSTTPGVTVATTVPVAEAGPKVPNGDVLFRLIIPKINVDAYVVEGITKDALKKGPGHFRESPMPGQLGNAAIAGHRTTYGAPFGDLDALKPGDLIETITPAGSFTYSVTGTVIVKPEEYSIVIPTIDPTVATLALATCEPKYTSRLRLVVQARLVPELSGQVLAPPTATLPDSPDIILPGDDTTSDTTSDTTPGSESVTTIDATGTTVPDSVDDTVDDTTSTETDGFAVGWFDDTAAIPHAIGWGLALLAVWLGSYFAGFALTRLYVAFLVGFAPTIVVLYFFFENVNRLLPPGL